MVNFCPGHGSTGKRHQSQECTGDAVTTRCAVRAVHRLSRTGTTDAARDSATRARPGPVQQAVAASAQTRSFECGDESAVADKGGDMLLPGYLGRNTLKMTADGRRRSAVETRSRRSAIGTRATAERIDSTRPRRSRAGDAAAHNAAGQAATQTSHNAARSPGISPERVRAREHTGAHRACVVRSVKSCLSRKWQQRQVRNLPENALIGGDNRGSNQGRTEPTAARTTVLRGARKSV